MDPESHYKILTNLIERAHFEKDILRISAFEKVSFQLDAKTLAADFLPSIERLSLVEPPSYECVFPIFFSGYYLVKYASSNVPFPMQVFDLAIEYSVIIVQYPEYFTFTQEKVEMAEGR